MNRVRAALTVLSALLLASTAQAVIIKGDGADPNCIAVASCPYVFDDDAFADAVVFT